MLGLIGTGPSVAPQNECVLSVMPSLPRSWKTVAGTVQPVTSSIAMSTKRSPGSVRIRIQWRV